MVFVDNLLGIVLIAVAALGIMVSVTPAKKQPVLLTQRLTAAGLSLFFAFVASRLLFR